MGRFVNTFLVPFSGIILWNVLMISAESRFPENANSITPLLPSLVHATKVTHRFDLLPVNQALPSDRAWHGSNSNKHHHKHKHRPSEIKTSSSKKPYTTRDADGTEHIHTFSEEHVHVNENFEVIEPSLMESAMVNSHKRFKFRGFKPEIHNFHSSKPNFNNYISKTPPSGPPIYNSNLGKIRPSPPDFSSGIHNYDETKIPKIMQKHPPRINDLNIVLNGQTKFKDFDSLLGHMGNIGYQQFEEQLKKKEEEEKHRETSSNIKETFHISDFLGKKPNPHNDYFHQQPSFQHNVKNISNFNIKPATYEYLNEHPISQQATKNLEQFKSGGYKKPRSPDYFLDEIPISKPLQAPRPNFYQQIPEKRPEPSSFQNIKHGGQFSGFNDNLPYKGHNQYSDTKPTTYKPETEHSRPNYPSSFDLNAPEKYSAILASKANTRQRPATPSSFKLPSQENKSRFRDNKPSYSSQSDGMLGQESTTVEQTRPNGDVNRLKPTRRPPPRNNEETSKNRSKTNASSSRGSVKYGDKIREGDLF